MQNIQIKKNGKQESSVPVLMDSAYADFKTRFTAWSLCF